MMTASILMQKQDSADRRFVSYSITSAISDLAPAYEGQHQVFAQPSTGGVLCSRRWERGDALGWDHPRFPSGGTSLGASSAGGAGGATVGESAGRKDAVGGVTSST